jgi:hypothetical protein
MKSELTRNYNMYDFVGMGLSVLCGIHCIITPLLLISMPRLGEGFQSIWLHSTLLIIMAYSFYQSVYKHFKIHKSKLTLYLGLSGFTFILLSYVNELSSHDHGHGHNHVEAHSDEALFMFFAITGAILLVTSHLLNIKKCKCLSGEGVCS